MRTGATKSSGSFLFQRLLPHPCLHRVEEEYFCDGSQLPGQRKAQLLWKNLLGEGYLDATLRKWKLARRQQGSHEHRQSS